MGMGTKLRFIVLVIAHVVAPISVGIDENGIEGRSEFRLNFRTQLGQIGMPTLTSEGATGIAVIAAHVRLKKTPPRLQM